MTTNETEITLELPSFRSIMVTAIILVVTGGVGLFILFVLTVPTLGPRWLLFFLATLVVSGISLPIVHYLHRRFPSKPVPGTPILLREALFAGAYIDAMLWLQFGRVLNFALAVFIGVGVIAVELLLRMRETSRFSAISKK
jgi:hypothetical protein